MPGVWLRAGGRREHTVDLHLAVRDDGLDLSLLLKVLEALAGQGAVDLEPVDEGGNGDETVRLDVLVQLVGSGLVEDDGVLRLVLDCSRLLAGCVATLGRARPHRDAADFQEVARGVAHDGSAPSTTVAVVHRDARLRNQLQPEAEKQDHQIHVPFPFDHFFFCFLAPVAGAILTDLLGVRWVVDGWSVDCLKWLEEVGGVVKEKWSPAKSLPSQCTAPHTAQIRAKTRAHSLTVRQAWAVRAGSRGGAPRVFLASGTTAPHFGRSPNQNYSGALRSTRPITDSCGATTKFCQTTGFAGQSHSGQQGQLALSCSEQLRATSTGPS